MSEDRATALVTTVAAGLPGISLPEVLDTTGLMSRVDRKFVVGHAEFLSFVDGIGGLLALDIEGRRSFGYSSTYFDTPGLAVYHAHRQGRRRRYKIRTRTYADTADTFCELKLSGRREVTIKRRQPHPSREADTMTPDALDFLDRELGTRFGLSAPRPLTASLVTGYRRTTLVTADRLTRITCDTSLRWSRGTATRRAAQGLVLLEVKSAGGATPVLKRLRLRETGLSKYCAGLVALGAAPGGNRWLPALRGIGAAPVSRSDAPWSRPR
ncbi:VTC domain-containing protein [Amycolatopsis minnesotensis]|uniref:VTC domain-containing protein n=1 Tax=Amycolatopsis minnesotensis TaxID=337894 RepID=A0ABN2SXG7_9PSEU